MASFNNLLILGAFIPLFIFLARTEEQWDYEPHLWSWNFTDEEQPEAVNDIEVLVQQEDPIDPRKRNHYLDSSKLQVKQLVEESCTQFRVDTRDAIICDKNRCDKLDFEWPTYDNQLTLIQTTKDGMRFHKVDLAFSEPQTSSMKHSREIISKPRIKFDLFDLFKPKPGSSSTTPKSRDSSTPGEEINQGDLTTSSTISPNEPIDDNNATRLITTFRLDTRRKKQKMVGFGGALSDSTCRNIKSLSPELSKSLIEDYYGDQGLRYTIARLSMGSSDFSTSPYTNNDLPREDDTRQLADNRTEDLEMSLFRLTVDDYEFKIPVARQAIATSRREIKFFSSLWSPPRWMKNNSDIVHGYLKGDVYGPYYKALAELMIKWMEAYRSNGIDLWATTGLNEPVTGVKPFIFHNSLGMNREDYVTFIKLYLGPIMRRRGFSDVKLLILDDNKGYAHNWVKSVLKDEIASQYVAGVAFHWYMNDEYENLNFLEKDYPDKLVIASEACNGFLPFQVHALPGNWDRGVAYMLDITRMLQKNVAAWVDWNMALDLTGGPSWINNNLDAAIIVNSKRDEYYKSPMFYAIGHFSRFIEPNSTRIESRLANARFDHPLEAVGFLTPNNYIVIVVVNTNRHQVPFRIIVDRRTIRVVQLRAESFNTITFKWRSST